MVSTSPARDSCLRMGMVSVLDITLLHRFCGLASGRGAIEQVSLNTPPRQRALFVEKHDLAFPELYSIHDVDALTRSIGFVEESNALDRKFRQCITQVLDVDS